MNEAGREIRRLLSLYRAGEIGEDELIADLGKLGAASAARGPTSERASDERSEHDRLEARRRLAERLDVYRAAEASGAEAVTLWAELTQDEQLAGGLRVIAAREAGHADLLARRVRELGREPAAEIPDWLAAYNASLLDPDATDDERLAAVASRFPDVEAALEPLRQQIERLGEDPLTAEMLRAIAQDEEATLRWLHEARALRDRRS